MSYSSPSHTETGLQQIQRLMIRIILIITGLILVTFAMALVLPIVIITVGDTFQWQVFDMEIIQPTLHDLELEIFGKTSESPFFMISLSFLIGIPLGMLFYTGIRFILGLAYSNTLGSAAFHVWLISLVVLIFFAYKEFKHTNDNIHLQKKNEQTQFKMLQKGLKIATEPFIKVRYVETGPTK